MESLLPISATTGCLPVLDFATERRTVATITCEHGVYTGESDHWAFLPSALRAADAWQRAHIVLAATSAPPADSSAGRDARPATTTRPSPTAAGDDPSDGRDADRGAGVADAAGGQPGMTQPWRVGSAAVPVTAMRPYPLALSTRVMRACPALAEKVRLIFDRDRCEDGPEHRVGVLAGGGFYGRYPAGEEQPGRPAPDRYHHPAEAVNHQPPPVGGGSPRDPDGRAHHRRGTAAA
jgi:hypothetical protein